MLFVLIKDRRYTNVGSLSPAGEWGESEHIKLSKTGESITYLILLFKEFCSAKGILASANA
jgi:hypothetical protein